jgi:amino acid transporter
LQLIAVELVKPPNQNQPYAIHIDIGWVFGAGKIIIPVPVNNRDQAEQIVNKLSNQISTVVTKASKSEETEEGTGINPTFRFWINIIGFAFLIYFLILNIPGMANTLKLLASTVIVIISVVGLFISFIFKKGKK